MQDRFEELAAPFPPDLVRQPCVLYGQQLDNVEALSIIQQLNSLIDVPSVRTFSIAAAHPSSKE